MADWRELARPALTKALRDKDQGMFSFTLVQLIGAASEKDISAFATELLGEMDHDTQVWWLDDCNCDGHLN
jgi:hypothetical protein